KLRKYKFFLAQTINQILFYGFVAVLVSNHTDDNYGEKKFEIRSEECSNMPDNREIENTKFAQFQCEKSEEINFYGRKNQNRKRQNKGDKYQHFTRSI